MSTRHDRWGRMKRLVAVLLGPSSRAPRDGVSRCTGLNLTDIRVRWRVIQASRREPAALEAWRKQMATRPRLPRHLQRTTTTPRPFVSSDLTTRGVDLRRFRFRRLLALLQHDPPLRRDGVSEDERPRRCSARGRAVGPISTRTSLASVCRRDPPGTGRAKSEDRGVAEPPRRISRSCSRTRR